MAGRRKAVASEVTATQVIGWFDGASDELVELVLGLVNSKREALAAKRKVQAENMAKARAGRKPRASNSPAPTNAAPQPVAAEA